MKLTALVLFILCATCVVAPGFSISKDYTKNGFGVPGYVKIIIPDVQEVITSVPETVLVTRPNSKGVQGFIEQKPASFPVAQPRVRTIGVDPHTNAPIRIMDMQNRGQGFYIGNYGGSLRYIKSPPKAGKY